MGEQTIAHTPAPTVPHKPKFSKLTQEDLTILTAMLKAGKTQTEVAQALSCDQSAVSRWASSLTDTTDIAKSFLRGNSLRMAQNIVKKGRAADHVKVLEGLEVLANAEVKGNVTIVIGGGATQVAVSVGGPSIEATRLDSGVPALDGACVSVDGDASER